MHPHAPAAQQVLPGPALRAMEALRDPGQTAPTSQGSIQNPLVQPRPPSQTS